jgi:hypothetical protein
MGFNYRVYGDSLHDSTESASTAAELWWLNGINYRVYMGLW